MGNTCKDAARQEKSYNSLGRRQQARKWLPHSFQLSGYPNTTDHEDIPPRIGATERHDF